MSLKKALNIGPSGLEVAYECCDFPALQALAGAIGAQKMSVLGSEILKQFNLIFDIARNDLYIAPRHT
jgi:hypothetical protein